MWMGNWFTHWNIFLKVDLALDEILRLQEEGPSDTDVSTVLEIEQRAHENGQQVNLHDKFVVKPILEETIWKVRVCDR